MVIKNLNKAVTRVRKAVKNRERIILYGDSDLDGVTSVIILKEALATLGGEVSAIYFPDREGEGYGVTFTALEKLKRLAPALLIVMDMGISSFKEIEKANELGFETILLDHHEVLGELPKASIIVDPKQPKETYSFKGFAACGVTFKFAEKLLGNLSQATRQNMLELAAIGTIADMMPREADNVEIIEEGLAALEDSWRPGIQAFLDLPEFSNIRSMEQRVSQMIGVLNIRDIKEGLPAAFRLFVSPSKENAAELVRNFMELHILRKQKVQDIVHDVKVFYAKEFIPLIFFGKESFDYILLGSAASIVSKEYGKPAFLYKIRDNGEALGSVRAPEGYRTVDAMKGCADLLLTFGGHQQASGFRLKTENLPKFKEHLLNYFKDHAALK